MLIGAIARLKGDIKSRRQAAKHVESPRILCCLCVKWKMWIVSSVLSRRETCFRPARWQRRARFSGWRFHATSGGDGAQRLWLRERSLLATRWRESMTLMVLGASLSYVTLSLLTSRWGRGQLFGVQLQYNAVLCNSTQCTLAYNTWPGWEIVAPSSFMT